MSRPLVSVYDTESATVSGTVTLPAVFTAPIRNDVVNQVHNLMSKNSRQAYGISLRAGMQVSNSDTFSCIFHRLPSKIF